MTALDDWTESVRVALRLDEVDSVLVLDLARDVAHGVMRPAAPLTAYLFGVAVGRGADPREAAAAIGELVKGWQGPRDPDEDGRPGRRRHEP